MSLSSVFWITVTRSTTLTDRDVLTSGQNHCHWIFICLFSRSPAVYKNVDSSISISTWYVLQNAIHSPFLCFMPDFCCHWLALIQFQCCFVLQSSISDFGNWSVADSPIPDPSKWIDFLFSFVKESKYNNVTNLENKTVVRQPPTKSPRIALNSSLILLFLFSLKWDGLSYYVTRLQTTFVLLNLVGRFAFVFMLIHRLYCSSIVLPFSDTLESRVQWKGTCPIVTRANYTGEDRWNLEYHRTATPGVW